MYNFTLIYPKLRHAPNYKPIERKNLFHEKKRPQKKKKKTIKDVPTDFVHEVIWIPLAPPSLP